MPYGLPSSTSYRHFTWNLEMSPMHPAPKKWFAITNLYFWTNHYHSSRKKCTSKYSHPNSGPTPRCTPIMKGYSWNPKFSTWLECSSPWGDLGPKNSLMIFCRFLEKMSWSWKTEFLGNIEFQKTGIYVTGRPECAGPSHREVKIDVWKYLQTIVMGLYAVSEQKLADRVPLTLPSRFLHPCGTSIVILRYLNGRKSVLRLLFFIVLQFLRSHLWLECFLGKISWLVLPLRDRRYGAMYHRCQMWDSTLVPSWGASQG